MNPLSLPCPLCKAEPWASCTSLADGKPRSVHVARLPDLGTAIAERVGLHDDPKGAWPWHT